MRHSPPPAASRRNVQIDTLRAIACISLVAFHVVGSSSGSGLELDPDHWMARANLALVDLRMPLFSFLSGMVLPALAGPPWPQIARKARRLLVPMAAVGTVFWLARHAMGYEQMPLTRIFWLPYAHFWFLQATFLIMAAFYLGSALSGGRAVLTAALIGVLGAALYISPFRLDQNVFSVMQAWKLAPFFAAGFLVATLRPRRLFAARRTVAAAGVAGAFAVGALLAAHPDALTGTGRRAVSIALGLTFCLCLLALRPGSAAMARLGRQSYPVYLFHVFFTAGMLKLVGTLLPGAPVPMAFALALAAGLAGPILLAQVLSRHRVTALAFLGVSRRPPAARPRPEADVTFT